MRYSFGDYKNEHLQEARLSGNLTEKELILKYGEDYANFCSAHGYEAAPLPDELETVIVVALSGGRIATSTSCYRMHAAGYASYYRRIGYRAKTLTYGELESFEALLAAPYGGPAQAGLI